MSPIVSVMTYFILFSIAIGLIIFGYDFLSNEFRNRQQLDTAVDGQVVQFYFDKNPRHPRITKIAYRYLVNGKFYLGESRIVESLYWRPKMGETIEVLHSSANPHLSALANPLYSYFTSGIYFWLGLFLFFTFSGLYFSKKRKIVS